MSESLRLPFATNKSETIMLRVVYYSFIKYMLTYCMITNGGTTSKPIVLVIASLCNLS
jgi:hypothetical protein